MTRSPAFFQRFQFPDGLTTYSNMAMLLYLFALPQFVSAQDPLDEQVETLATIEVPATVVVREERQIIVSKPEIQNLMPLPPTDQLIRSKVAPASIHTQNRTEVVQDNIANTKGVRTRVKPAKAERPLYPRFAREQGWEGTVVLRIHVNRKGSVDSVQTRQSSGYSVLDDSAKQSVKRWTFEPAKDGEFRIPAIVDLPIRFDLDE